VKLKFLTIFVVTTVVAMVTMIIMARMGAPSRASIHLARAAQEADAKAIAHDWAQYAYAPVAEAGFTDGLSNFVASAAGIAQLDNAKKQSLLDEMGVFFRAYHEGTYEAYQAFRFPPGITFNWKTNKYGSIDEVLTKPPGFGPPNAYHRWHAQIESKPNHVDQLPKEEKFKVFLKLFSGESLYNNYFSAICFDQSHIIINDTTNIEKPWRIAFCPPNSFRTNSASVRAPFPNLGYFAQKNTYSLVKFADSIDNLKLEFGNVLTADCFFFIKRPAPDSVLPVIVRFYWNPNASQWLPDDVVICNLWNKGDNWPLF
jgi:hypothetical protein